MTKPNKDGWIRHRGGKCPVDGGTLVDVRYRDGSILEYLEALRDYKFKTDHHSGWDAGADYWSHDNLPGDIMAWKLSRPSILDNPGEPNEALKEVLELDSHKTEQANVIGFMGVEEIPVQVNSVPDMKPWQVTVVAKPDDPRTMRDRIREIDEASKEEEARHCAAMKAYDEERTFLVAKLKAEGLALVEPAIKAGDRVTFEDMSDWRNWRVGDLVEVIAETEESDAPIGAVMEVTDIDSYDEFQPIWLGAYCPLASSLRWHSRPHP